MTSIALVTLPVVVLVTCLAPVLFALRELGRTRRLTWLNREQWSAAILLLGPFGAAAFLWLERDR